MAGNTGRVGGQWNNKNAEAWTEEKALKFGEDLIDWMLPKIVTEEKYNPKTKKIEIKDVDMHATNIYYEEFILMVKRVPVNILKYLEKKFTSFYEYKKTAEGIQRIKLMKYSSHNKINPVVSIFLLKAMHGLKDRVEVIKNDNEEMGNKINDFLNKMESKELK